MLKFVAQNTRSTATLYVSQWPSPPLRCLGMPARKPTKVSSSSTAPAVSVNSFAALADQEEVEHTEVQSVAVQSTNGTAASPSPGNQHKARRLRDPLVWIDLEMTGLDIERDTIIEVACIVSDGDLNTRIEGPSLAIHHSEEVLGSMNDWCKEHHGKSGLTQRVRESSVSMRDAELALLEFVQRHAPDAGMAQLAGNSVHVDRMFLLKHMPELAAYLSYRIVDVSTIRELAKRWFPTAAKKAPKKSNAHTALSDIRESVQELMYYKKAIFIGGGKGR